LRVALHADAVAHAIPGGVGSYVRCLADALLSSDVDMRFVVSRSAESLPSNWPRERVQRSALPLHALYAAWNFLRMPSLSGFDVVHAPGLVMPAARGARLVAAVHDDNVEQFPELVPPFWRALYRRGFRVALREASVLVAPCEATKVRLVDVYGVDDRRVVVAPLAPVMRPGHAADPAILSHKGIRAPYVLHVGTLEPRKNQPLLVRAFAAANLPDHQLVLAGAAGWGATATHDAIRETGTTDRVVVTGRVTDAQLASLYGHADAFAFPSVYEGFGLPLLEAFAYGLPSLASNDAALTEVGGGAALHSDAAGLSSALVSVCTDEALRSSLREAGPRRAAEFTWERTARLTREAWASAVSAGRQ
jgi:glycosyltransferase involved in cell wall biosynthesis